MPAPRRGPSAGETPCQRAPSGKFAIHGDSNKDGRSPRAEQIGLPVGSITTEAHCGSGIDRGLHGLAGGRFDDVDHCFRAGETDAESGAEAGARDGAQVEEARA